VVDSRWRVGCRKDAAGLRDVEERQTPRLSAVGRTAGWRTADLCSDEAVWRHTYTIRFALYLGVFALSEVGCQRGDERSKGSRQDRRNNPKTLPTHSPLCFFGRLRFEPSNKTNKTAVHWVSSWCTSPVALSNTEKTSCGVRCRLTEQHL
jgi:hypothetical protein